MKTMDASKENADKAAVALATIWSAVPVAVRDTMEKDFDVCRNFLLAARNKLPFQKSFNKERSVARK